VFGHSFLEPILARQWRRMRERREAALAASIAALLPPQPGAVPPAVPFTPPPAGENVRRWWILFGAPAVLLAVALTAGSVAVAVLLCR
jgi:hypothetical protein